MISCLTYSFLVLLCNFYAWQSSDPAGSQKPRGQPRFERAESVYLTYSFPVRRFRFLQLGCPYSLCWTSTDFPVSEMPRQQSAKYPPPLLSQSVELDPRLLELIIHPGSGILLESRQRNRLVFPIECGPSRLNCRGVGDVSLAHRCADVKDRWDWDLYRTLMISQWIS